MTTDEGSCECCAGNTTETPAIVANPPGLRAIAFRVGTHATFKSSLLARLSSAEFPALVPRRELPDGSAVHGLGTRRDDDWTIGLCDAFATMADVLTFYQERIANEAFLRTAVERRSVLELSQLVGYEPAPGVAASTALAFTLDVPVQVPGATPMPPPQPVTIPIGTRVQSVPGPDELPQSFETIEAIVARPGWNSLSVQSSVRERPYSEQKVAWLAGTATGVAPGDVIAFIGAERDTNDASELWEVRPLTRVYADTQRNVTRIEWAEGLGQFAAHDDPPGDGARIYALRQRAGLFGGNAIDPNMIDWAKIPTHAKLVDGINEDGDVNTIESYVWKNFVIDAANSRVDLDAVYPKVVRDSWLALTGGTAGGLHEGAWLYRIDDARQIARASYGLSGKVTRLSVDTSAHLADFSLTDTAAYAQSEELSFAERPLLYPLYGDVIALSSRELDLELEQSLAVQGKRQRLAAPPEPDAVTFPDDPARLALPNESFIVLAPPAKVVGGSVIPVLPEELDAGAIPDDTLLRWTLRDRDGATVTIEAVARVMRLAPALESDPVVDETVTIDEAADAILHDLDRTTVKLAASLANCYERASVRINANVAPATHGETVGEIGGSGVALATNQRFTLRQAPLTYVSASNPQGRESTLTVRVNDLEWTEVPALFAQEPTAHAYSLRQDDDGKTVVQFGDGVEGARLPTGTDNVRFTYRKGLGVAGNVRAGTVTSLLSRPLGVRSAVNPLAAVGGEDPESRDDARRNAPNTVLTLDRAVSLLDYADFARAFAGIEKAVAAWIARGAARGMHITVAGAGGGAITPETQTHQDLLDALRAYGDALLPLTLQSYAPATFVLGAKVVVKPEHEVERVLAEVDAALRTDFSFEARDFGKPVTIDEVMASVHRVAGVEAVDVDVLHRSGLAAGAEPEARIFPSPGVVNDDGTVSPAELLTLDPDGLTLEVLLP